jgi:hypothetical protein
LYFSKSDLASINHSWWFKGDKIQNLALYLIFILDKTSERLEDSNISEGFTHYGRTYPEIFM